jgi:hypothetical protein
MPGWNFGVTRTRDGRGIDFEWKIEDGLMVVLCAGGKRISRLWKASNHEHLASLIAKELYERRR